ncbi:MAG TPA: alpha/beta fold hydrolase [Thermoanaerobaculia bacterium]
MAPVAFLGGNGHCAARLARVEGIELYDVPYPGFEDRPRARSLDDFLDVVSGHLRAVSAPLVYAMGIGGLIALCLRARGELAGTPLLMQGPILWGLERRWMPRLMRLGLAQALLLRLFATPGFQRRFARKYFTHPPSPATLAAFFDGYSRCSAAPDFFAWLNPRLLRSLERDLALRPEALDGIRIWWGGKDRVVTLQELEWTKEALALGDRWPLRVFPDWGHYPMIDDPTGWAGELRRAVAEAGAV